MILIGNGKRRAHFCETRLASPERPEYVHAPALPHRRAPGAVMTNPMERISSGPRLTEVGMSPQPGADVIVIADRDPTAVEPCLQNILAHGGPHLRRLIVVDDDSADPDMPEMLERLARSIRGCTSSAIRHDSRGSVRTTADLKNARATRCS